MPEADADDGYRSLLAAGELDAGRKRSVEVEGRRILLLNAGGTLYAVEDRCTHAEVALEAGRLRGCELECPLHGGRFDVRDGRPLAGPPQRPLTTFAVRVRDGWIEVRV